ncbi:unnamed protein product, partial [Mesorhabditis spiculigera]
MGKDDKKKKSKSKHSRHATKGSRNKPSNQQASVTHSINQSVSIDVQEQVQAFCMSILKRTFQGVRKEFADNKRNFAMSKCSVFQKNPQKNRYKDVGCLDDSRVVLRDNGADDYIHANYVATPESAKRFICCQAPLDKTCTDHWKMIVQENVEVILMLCNFKEKDTVKSAEYFPFTDITQPKIFGPYTVRCTNKENFKWPTPTTAVVVVSSLVVEVDGRQHKVLHYHWQDWPDRGVPPADQAPIDLLNVLSRTKHPMVVHCSAGIGRTGSIVLIQYIQEAIKAGKPCDKVEKLLIELRNQRANSVQTDYQYLYVHQVLLNYYHKAEYLDASIEGPLAEFTAEYNKYTANVKF